MHIKEAKNHFGQESNTFDLATLFTSVTLDHCRKQILRMFVVGNRLSVNVTDHLGIMAHLAISDHCQFERLILKSAINFP